MRSFKGQASLEVLLVLAFSIIVALAIGLPYVENQRISNVGIVTKSALLPFLEKNPNEMRIASISIQDISTGSTQTDFQVNVITRGKANADWLTLLSSESACVNICETIRDGSLATHVTFTWENNPTPVLCTSVPC